MSLSSELNKGPCKFLSACENGEKCQNGMIKTSGIYHQVRHNRRKGKYSKKSVQPLPSTEIRCGSYICED